MNTNYCIPSKKALWDRLSHLGAIYWSRMKSRNKIFLYFILYIHKDWFGLTFWGYNYGPIKNIFQEIIPYASNLRKCYISCLLFHACEDLKSFSKLGEEGICHCCNLQICDNCHICNGSSKSQEWNAHCGGKKNLAVSSDANFHFLPLIKWAWCLLA